MQQPAPKKILIVDDDPKLRYIIQLNLAAAGYEVQSAEDGPSGLGLARTWQPDLVLLDVGLPRMNGFDVCKTLREEPGYPDCSILFLTARGEMADKGEGFRAGADDYLAKPFDPRELLWRCEALLKRLRRPNAGDEPTIVGELEFLPATLEVKTPDRIVRLTRIEFTLISALAECPNEAVPPETLMRRLWGTETAEGVAAIRVYINRIRQRLEPSPEVPRYLRTVRGRGYALHAS